MFKVYNDEGYEQIFTKEQLKKVFSEDEIKRICKRVESKIRGYEIVNYGEDI